MKDIKFFSVTKRNTRSHCTVIQKYCGIFVTCFFNFYHRFISFKNYIAAQSKSENFTMLQNKSMHNMLKTGFTKIS